VQRRCSITIGIARGVGYVVSPLALCFSGSLGWLRRGLGMLRERSLAGQNNASRRLMSPRHLSIPSPSFLCPSTIPSNRLTNSCLNRNPGRILQHPSCKRGQDPSGNEGVRGKRRQHRRHALLEFRFRQGLDEQRKLDGIEQAGRSSTCIHHFSAAFQIQPMSCHGSREGGD
jgi:hypothetical protein